MMKKIINTHENDFFYHAVSSDQIKKIKNKQMKKVLESKYLELFYNDEKNMLVQKWQKATATMTVDELKDLMFKQNDVYNLYRPRVILAYLIDFLFPIDPELQEWIDENSTAVAMKTLEKGAVIMSKDIVAQMAVEQMMEEKEGKNMVTRYFSDEEEAKDWLFE